MSLKKLIFEYLDKALLMSLATSVNNQPWVCSVWYAVDEDMNIYWISSTTRRHSHEVLDNKKIAGAIVLPQTPKDAPRGVQFQGIAKMLTEEKDIKKAMSVYAGRIFPEEKIKEFMNSPTHPHRFYRVKPTQFVLFDAVNFPENSRRELNL